MSQSPPQQRARRRDYSPEKSSPLRYNSNASTNSSVQSIYSNPFAPSRSSTVASTASSGYSYTSVGQKRGIGEMSPTRQDFREPGHKAHSSISTDYRSARESLKPLSQAPHVYPSEQRHSWQPSHSRRDSNSENQYVPSYDGRASPTVSPHACHESARGRPGRDNTSAISSSAFSDGQSEQYISNLAAPDFSDLKKSSTPHLRTLSKFAQEGDKEEYSVSARSSVAGLSGRKQLKRTGSIRGSESTHATTIDSRGSAWAESNWMEKQRQFLQAYEYLCHIGEAKEWMEKIILQSLPPIVRLEEALRDGVSLAEIVQAFYPERRIRIFRNAKLQYRHSDNIAIFFRFLAEMELPELFRFELIDLYEKKNIPKVIYCIHALSWLLFRKGMVDFKIGNLLGQLEFEQHELEEMQKGLDRAGVSMPSFAGMGESFGNEPVKPVETEEERISRELGESEEALLDLQSQIRGCILRMNLGETMQNLWEVEGAILEIQSRIRGKWAREIYQYKLGMKQSAVHVQSAVRGFLVRARESAREHRLERSQTAVTTIQSLIRGSRVRRDQRTLKTALRRCDHQTADIQAEIRGALKRNQIMNMREEAAILAPSTDRLQSIIRAMLTRRSIRDDQARLERMQHSISAMQGAIRGFLLRSQISLQEERLRHLDLTWRALQATCRGFISRNKLQCLKSSLRNSQPTTINLQACLRGFVSRRHCGDLIADLSQHEPTATVLQASIKGFLLRRQVESNVRYWSSQLKEIVAIQSGARACNLRRCLSRQYSMLCKNMSEIIQLQACVRAMNLRLDIGRLLSQLEESEDEVVEFQAAIRAALLREKYAEKQRFFKANMEKVVKVQSFVRAKLQGEAYKSLTSGENPPVNTVKSFVHLLNDSDFDFDEEIEFERLRKTVVQHVRQNEMADQYISQLDIKIALLVKNKITLDEVVKHQKHFGGAAGGLLTRNEASSKDPFDLKALNKTSRRKLEQYQELFFLLQTQPQYLARLFRRIREQGLIDKESERIKHLVMGLFGYAQKRREEYYLVKVLARSMREEIEQSPSLSEFLRGNFFWSKLFGAYIKSPRDRKFMRDLLHPIVKEGIIENRDLDLESDPMQIYLCAIENEELRIGQRSKRNPDIPREAAIRDPETKRIFIAHLQDLRDIADQFFLYLEEQLHRMPFGVRYIAQQMYQCLTMKFPHDEKGHLLQIVGHWVWKNYLQPALTEPEKFGVVDRGLSQEHRRNLGEVAKVVGQVAAGRLFGGENVFLQPLNSYLTESIERLGDIWGLLIDVPSAEATFEIDEFNDLYARTKPTLYIKMADIFAVHQLVAQEASRICPHRDDGLQEIIRELGNVKNNETELGGVSSSEVCLTLNPKLHEQEDPDAEVKALLTETKRCILYIIRVQSGGDLMDIMVKPITEEDEDRWDGLVRDELSGHNSRRGAYAEANTLTDLASLSYAELKRIALENIIQLEMFGKLSRHNHYQDLLNAIAVDIRTKHRRRVERQRELESVRLTLARLNDQAGFLEGQLKTYNDYVEQAMVTLQNKKGKKRFLLPFTKQWDHERELARSGRVPKFGSYKYSAQDLANRGVLLAWEGYTERQYQHLDLTISSNEVGVFSLEGSNGPISIPGASAQVPLDDLLQAQFNNTQALEFFDDSGKAGGGLKVNVNLFVHLIMRKFYGDKD